MTDQSPNNLAEIEGLLASRQQLAGWLDRLDQAGSRAPDAVRAKVRSDYQARLAQVVAQLRAYSDQIAARLGGLKAQAVEFRQLRTEELEARAEAELRHSVGEFTEEEWQAVEGRATGKVVSFDQELDRLSEEIGRLEEVQSLILPGRVAAPPPAPEVERPRPAAPSVAPVASRESDDMPAMLPGEPLGESSGPPPLTLVRDERVEPGEPAEETPAAARPEAPKFTPRPGMPRPREGGPARAIPFPAPTPTPGPPDELAFLRSVSLDSPPPSTRITPHSAPNSAGMFDREDRPSQGVAKTLKCGECGSLNRPTEWYCERCGAELAAL